MASKGTCCHSIRHRDCCGSDNKCFCCEEECAHADLKSEFSAEHKDSCHCMPENPAFAIVAPQAACCVDEDCCDTVSEIFDQKRRSDCKKPGNGDFMSGEDQQNKTEVLICKNIEDKSGSGSCCGDKEQCGSWAKSDSEVQSSANRSQSYCSEQSAVVEFDGDSVAEVGVDGHKKLEAGLECCSDNPGRPICCPEKKSTDCAAEGEGSDAYPITEIEGGSKKRKNCTALNQDPVLNESFHFSEKDSKRCQKSDEAPCYCDDESASDLVEDNSCEKKGLLLKTKNGKSDRSILPTNQSSRMGSYGSTAKIDATNERRKFLQVQVPDPAEDMEARVTVSSFEMEPLIKTTKFRIQNICCGKEAEMMKRELEPRSGITAVSVNIVGRVGFVKHDENIISATDIVNILNKFHLGVSIMESSNHEDEQTLAREVFVRLATKLAVLGILTALFIVVLVARAREYDWLKWVAITEIIVGVIPIIRKIIINLMKKVFIDINMLMLIAVAGTVSLQEWLEGATLIFVFAVAEVLQQYCGYKVQCAISGIVVQLPDKAVLAETGKSVSIDEIQIGTRIVVCAGERIALDGEVVKGQAAIDESSITGEAIPVEKGLGSQTYSGTIVQSGFLEIVTTSTSKNSTVSKVSQMVQEAQSKTSHTEKMMNNFAKVYTPLVLITALLVFAIPAILAELKVGSYKSQLHSWGIRALIVLLIACPCALLMSVPIPIVSGITTAARNGTLVKGGTDMETLAKINSMAFDKTGTLTEGKFKVVNFKEFGGHFEQNELLELIVALEIKSSHPVASALVSHYSGCITDKIAISGANVGLPDVTDFKSVPGQGLKGIVCDHSVVVGNMKMLRQFSVHVPIEAERLFASWSDRGETVIFCSIDQQLSLMIGLADTPRDTARFAVQMLKNLGINSVILTGDCGGAAAAAMIATGAENFIASMKPEQKLEWIRNAQRPSPKTRIRVAMVGDGVNDGPSLAAADVGIAIGASATALAIESAGVALMSDSLTRIPELLVLSRFTRLVVIQNIGIALAIKVAVVIATMFGSLALWMAVLSDVAGLLLVILNGIRPLFWRQDKRLVLDELKETDSGETKAFVQAGEWNEDGMGMFEVRL